MNQWTEKHVIITLQDFKLLQADLPSPAYSNWPYNHELDFASAFKTGRICVKQSDIVQVKLKAVEVTDGIQLPTQLSLKLQQSRIKS